MKSSCHNKYCLRLIKLGPITSVSMDFAIIVLDELFYESTILVQDLVSHVGDVMEHSLIFHLRQKNTISTLMALIHLNIGTKIQ